MTGAQEFVPLLLNAVNEGRLTLHQVADHAAERPARTFGMFPRKGVVQIGADADLTVVDMNRKVEFRHEDMLSKAGHTSWVGMKAKGAARSEEHTSELQSLMRISYAVFCLKKKNEHINS